MMNKAKHSLLLLFNCCCFLVAFSQKTVHIPNYLQNPSDVNGAQFTWSKTAQSTNFILIWGNTVGTNPANYPDPNLAFNPSKILDTMEYIYDEFKALGFLDDAPGTNLAQYKVPIVIYGTWGANGQQGFANGGDADGIIGAFWVHPNAMLDGGVAAHEFAHSLQAQNNIDYRNDHGLGYSWQNSGIFWETHGNFMRNLLYPQFVTAWGMDVYHYETWGDWKNTYENYALLMGIMESEGINMVNRLWRESLSNEYPLQAYKRLAGYSQAEFNDSLYQYARRMATYDFSYNNLGSHFRQKRNADLNNWLPTIQNVWSILRKVPNGTNRYEIPIEQAPEEFAYNVIPLYPHPDSCAVIVKFKGHTEVNSHAGWRYGFVAAKANGTVSRYSPTYSENTAEINFSLEGNETKLFLVVMGAPKNQITTNPSNDTWHGYPKHFRFPYEVNISGAVPEGHQTPASFRSQLKSNGHIHANGGGWVQNSATVASSVYVGPMAIVRGNANITGQVRIEGTALVRNATMSGNVRILDNAFVDGGTYSNNAKVQGNAFVVNATMSGSALVGMRARVDNYNLSGTVEVGGDVVVYNDAGNCNNGVHYRLTNYYDNKLLECDGRTATHPVNLDVNSTYSLFTNTAMALQCNCGGTTTVVADSIAIAKPTCTDLASGGVQFHISTSCEPFNYVWSKGTETGNNLTGLSPGSYSFTITDALGKEGEFPVEIPTPAALSSVVNANANYYCFTGAGGTASMVVSGGTAPFAYQWSNGETTAAVNNLLPGPYTVIATDALGCTASGSTTVLLNGPLDANISYTPVQCSGAGVGSAFVGVNGGVSPVTYQWSNGETTAGIDNLDPGTYTVTVTDAIGCTYMAARDIVPTGQLDAGYSTHPAYCFQSGGGSIELTLDGTAPYTYQWSNGETTAHIDSLAPGIYTVTATDAIGCTFSTEVEVESYGELGASLSTTPISCYDGSDGSAAISPQGGNAPYAWLWEGGQTDSLRTNLGSGDYSVTISDALGCSNNLQFTLTEPVALALQIAQANLTCSDATNGSASVTATGGTPNYVYLWNNGATSADIEGLMAGNYSVTITDGNGCSATSGVTLTSPIALTLTVEGPASLCPAQEGMVSALASGGVGPYGFHWDDASSGESLLVTGGGTYAITVTDANGCALADSVTIGESPNLELSLSTTPIQCHDSADGSATVTPLTGTAPFHWLWQNGETDSLLTGLNGSYAVTVTDAGGCTSQVQFTLTAPPALALEFSAQATSCFGAIDGSATATANGGSHGYTYTWNNGQTGNVIANLPAGIYAFTVTDINGCTAAAGFSVSSPDSLELAVQAPALICPDGTGNMTANAAGGTLPYDYLWSNGTMDTTLAAGAGSYTITLTDANGCSQVQAVEMQEVPAFTLTADVLHTSAATAADGGIFPMNLSGGLPPYAYLWNTGDTSLSLIFVPPGDYSLTVTDSLGCAFVFDFTVSFDNAAYDQAPPGLRATIAPNPSAGAAALHLEAKQAGFIQWAVGDVHGRVLHSAVATLQVGNNSVALPQGLAAGMYWLRVQDAAGRWLALRWVVL